MGVKTQTTNHVLTNPTGTIVGLSGSLIGLNVGMLGLTNQYNNRNQVRLRGGSSTTTTPLVAED